MQLHLTTYWDDIGDDIDDEGPKICKASEEESQELQPIWLIDTQSNNVLNNVAISFNVGLC